MFISNIHYQDVIINLTLQIYIIKWILALNLIFIDLPNFVMILIYLLIIHNQSVVNYISFQYQMVRFFLLQLLYY